jgi:type III secretion protein U
MSEEKTEEPTPRKIKKARDKGEAFKSADLTQTVVFIALLGLGVVGIEYWLPMLQAELAFWPARMAHLSAAAEDEWWPLLVASAVSSVNLLVAPMLAMLGVSAVVGLLAAGLQVRGILSAAPLMPKAERFNPGANLKRLVSTRNFYDLIKILFKVGLVGAVVYVAVRAALPDWLALLSSSVSVMGYGTLLARALLMMALACIAIYVLASGVDFGHQFYEYMKQQRMSKDELRREYKEIEGDPYIKGYRRALMQAMVMPAADDDLAGARVVVTNPTHYAVALAYDALRGGIPHVLTKGVDQAALKIRQRAQHAGLPVVENRALARKLYAKVEAGAAIPRELFADVAQLIAQLPPPVVDIRGAQEGSVRRL